jgi:hypothetical protein
MSLLNDNAQFEMWLATYVAVTAIVLLLLQPLCAGQYEIEVSTQAPTFTVFDDTVVVVDLAFVRYNGMMKVTGCVLHDV